MNTFLSFMATFIFFLLKDVDNTQAAALKCSNSKPIVDLIDHKADTHHNNTEDNDVNNSQKEGNKNSINNIFQNIQCTLEKVKPWVAELQQEAKRLEEAAKLLGLGILNSFGEFVDKLVEQKAETQNTTVVYDDSAANSTEIVTNQISQHVCPDGFVADHIGVCTRID